MAKTTKQKPIIMWGCPNCGSPTAHQKIVSTGTRPIRFGIHSCEQMGPMYIQLGELDLNKALGMNLHMEQVFTCAVCGHDFSVPVIWHRRKGHPRGRQ